MISYHTNRIKSCSFITLLFSAVYCNVCLIVRPYLLLVLQLAIHDLSRGASRLENGNVPRCSLALSNVMLHECLFEQCYLWLRPNKLLTYLLIDAVELIVRKYLLLWWSFCVLEVTFYSLIKFQDKISSYALTKLRSENLWKSRTVVSDRPLRLQLIICRKKEHLSWLFL